MLVDSDVHRVRVVLDRVAHRDSHQAKEPFPGDVIHLQYLLHHLIIFEDSFGLLERTLLRYETLLDT